MDLQKRNRKIFGVCFIVCFICLSSLFIIYNYGFKFGYTKVLPLLINNTPNERWNIKNHTYNSELKTNIFKSNVILNELGPGFNATGLRNTPPNEVDVIGSKGPALSFYRINTTQSDHIGVRRILPDGRPEACQRIKYPPNLPKASIVIIFRDEWPSVLIRTVYSVLNNTPSNILQEVVLVDDGSTNTELRKKVKAYFGNVQKVKLVVNPKPLGLMMARQRGIEFTTSEYFIVMDSHIEFSHGWLEPLIARLVEKPRNLLCSHVGNIDKNTFKVGFAKTPNLNFMTYDPLTFNELWASYSRTYITGRNGSVDPAPIAGVQGMSIAMRKDFFIQLGGFDPGMRQWGSEQIELSIKVWMCGGRVEKIPCSKIAHLYRTTPWGRVNSTSDFLVANSLRTSEVWLDDPYKSIIRDVIGKHSKYDIGDLTDRRRIRKENNCKPYQYFVDMVKTFSDVYLLDKIKAKGNIRCKHTDTCLAVDKLPDKSYQLALHPCANTSKQYFVLTERNQVRSVQGNLLRLKPKPKTDEKMVVEVKRSSSYTLMRDAVWQYRNDFSLFHERTKRCLTVFNTTMFTLETCDGFEQQWLWERV